MKKIIKFLLIILFLVGTFLLSIKLEFISAAEKYPFNGIINADSLVVRSEASNSASAMTELAYGTRFKVLEASGNFYKINFDDNKVGYVLSKYVINVDSNTLTEDVSGIEPYKDYCDSLKKKGFLDSYCPYLYYLHSKYSGWQFEADVINLDFMQVALEESKRSVLATNNKNYWISDKAHEGSYYYVNPSVNASFLDPRNSLFEETIFQFLDFQTSKDFTNDITMSKISGKGNLSKYYEAYKNAGSVYEVNPLHLMARSKQEGANNATYNSVAGIFTTNVSKDPTYTYNKMARGNTLDGYYNYYNIGAWYGNGYSAIGRGLAYAGGFLEKDECYDINNGIGIYNTSRCGEISYQRPWNTPEKAISGGAEFIALGYVKKGQNTNYYEKFNVSSKTQYDIYTHQYMTNIHAPASESNSLKDAYAAGNLMNSEFTFVIPVYKNMPNDASEAVDKSTNSKLSSITVDDKVITGFDSDVVEYNYNVITDSEEIKIGAKTEDSKARVTGTGTYSFSEGVVSVTLVVTAEDGSTTNYKLIVKQIVPVKNITVGEIVSKMGVKIDGSIMYGISPNTSVTTLVNTVVKNKGTATVVDSSGKAKSSGIFNTGDKITIKGTIESKIFVISVRGDTNGDGKISILDLLNIQKHILGRGILIEQKFYSGDVNYDGKVSIVDLLLVQKNILGRGNL